MDPSQRHRFVIVGAGLAGAATAWHLRRAGVTDVLVLEREDLPGRHSSGRNAAILRAGMEDPVLQALSDESAPVLRRGELAHFRATGGLLVGQGDEDVGARVPPARGRARYCDQDGVLDVAGLLATYLSGAVVRYGVVVEGYARARDGLRVQTSAGVLQAEVLVNAAGAWAGALGGLPLVPRNRHVYVSAPDPGIDPAWPFVWDPCGGYYFRPESGGWMLSPCDETDAAPGDYSEAAARLEDLGEKLAAHQPGLGDLRIAHTWVGQRTFAPDRRPILGFDAHEPRLFHVTGLGGHGMTLSYAVGRLAADVLLGRAVPDARLAPTRYAGP